MTSKELNLKLKYFLPELAELYDEETNWQDGDDTGSHIVYGDVFTPFVIEKIKLKDDKTVKKSFKFMEELLSLSDKYANEVIAFSVIEALLFNGEIKGVDFMRFCGAKTLELTEEILGKGEK